MVEIWYDVDSRLDDLKKEMKKKLLGHSINPIANRCRQSEGDFVKISRCTPTNGEDESYQVLFISSGKCE